MHKISLPVFSVDKFFGFVVKKMVGLWRCQFASIAGESSWQCCELLRESSCCDGGAATVWVARAEHGHASASCSKQQLSTTADGIDLELEYTTLINTTSCLLSYDHTLLKIIPSYSSHIQVAWKMDLLRQQFIPTTSDFQNKKS